MSDSTRAVIRTAIQIIAGLAVAFPVIVADLNLDVTVKWVAVALMVSMAVTRVMQIPAVDKLFTDLGIGRQGKHVAGDDPYE